MRILTLGLASALCVGNAWAAARPYAHLQVISQFTLEEYNPDAENPGTRITRRTIGRESWRALLRVEHVDAASWARIKRSFPGVNMEFHDLVWASNAPAAGPGGQPAPEWPVTYTQEETTWTLLDRNRKRPDQPSDMQLVKTGETRSGGKADYLAGFFVEMMKSQPMAADDEPDPVPLIPGAEIEPEAPALTPFVYLLSTAVSGFMVKSNITGVTRSYDAELEQWSESRFGPPRSASTPPVYARRTRPGTRHDGFAVSRLRRAGLPAKLVEQLVTRPGSIGAPIQQTGTLSEIEHASDEPGAPVIRRRDTTTTVRIRIEAADLPPAEPLDHLPPPVPLAGR
jgi:hypothetical protein